LMIWKVIGQSVIGSSHIHSGKGCEDAMHYQTVRIGDDEALICFVSDGAGSAKYAAKASDTAVLLATNLALEMITSETLSDNNLLKIAEGIYDELLHLSNEAQEPKNEFSCTLLGLVILPHRAGFIQIGDGAMI